MKTRLNLIFAVTAGLSLAVDAETTLVYELADAQGENQQQTYTLHGRWARVDYLTEAHDYHLILDAGFMIMHVIDSEKAVFSTFGESPYHQGKQVQTASVDTATPKQADSHVTKVSSLKPTGGRDTVAGIRCNVVNEIVNEQPVAEHCVADAASLGMNQREAITMARLIEFSKKWTDPDWIAVQKDEQFISIRSRPVDGEVTFLLKEVTHETPPGDYFRVPPEYKKLDNSAADHQGLIAGKK